MGMDDDTNDGAARPASSRTPLLGHAQPSSHRRHGARLSLVSIAGTVQVPKANTSSKIVGLLCLVMFTASSAGGFVVIPLTQLMEHVVCYQYYGETGGLDIPIDEKLCKAPAVQSQIAFIFAITTMLEAIIGLLVAFPWGIVADRLGRKPVFTITLTGLSAGVAWQMMVLYLYRVLPIRLVWLSPLSLLFGGGAAVIVAVVMTMVSDVVEEEQRAVAIMRIHVSSLVGGLVSPAFASAMMAETGPWPVLCVSISCLIGAAIVFLFVPETLSHKVADQETEHSDHPTDLRSHLLHVVDRLRESISILKSPSLILLVLTGLGTYPVVQSTLGFAVIFMSERYDIAIKDTGYVQTLYGVMQAVQALLVLPLMAKLLVRDKTPAFFRVPNQQKRDLYLARWSYAFLAFGSLVLGLAPTLPAFVLGLFILALGSGYTSYTKALMSLYVDPEHRSRLFSLVAMVDQLGNTYASPMSAELFSLGMKLGGAWMGLPYYAVALICTVIVVLLVFVRVPQPGVDASPPPPAYEGLAGEGGQQGG